MTDYTVAVLEDSICILDLLGKSSDGLSLAEITMASGLVKNKVFRILFTLEKHLFVQRDQHGTYRLGYRLLELSQSVQQESVLIAASRPVMEELVRQTSESIFLGIASGSDAVCIAARESPQSIRLFAQVGRRTPLHTGGVPKVLLTFMPEEERNRLIKSYFADNKQLLDNGLPLSKLLRQIDEVQEQGYVIVVDELDYGAHSIAAPIRNHEGKVIAGISIAGPSNRFPPERVQWYVELIQEAGERISGALGYHVLHASANGVMNS